jgi:hypothetical protein
MQANTIAYTYNHDNDGGTTAEVAVSLERYREAGPDSTVYRTDSHNGTVLVDLAQFYRTPNKRSGNYLGNEKVAYKRTKTFVVKDALANDINASAIGELSLSLPYGMTQAQKLSFFMELLGFSTSSEGKAALLKLIYTLDV